MDIIEQAGTALAFPSQTLHLGRDRGNDPVNAEDAEASVQEWPEWDMDIIEQAGTALAFPSQTLHLGRDRGNDPVKAKDAEASVQGWRDKS